MHRVNFLGGICCADCNSAALVMCEVSGEMKATLILIVSHSTNDDVISF
jgi:hypothetical protein